MTLSLSFLIREMGPFLQDRVCERLARRLLRGRSSVKHLPGCEPLPSLPHLSCHGSFQHHQPQHQHCLFMHRVMFLREPISSFHQLWAGSMVTAPERGAPSSQDISRPLLWLHTFSQGERESCKGQGEAHTGPALKGPSRPLSHPST